MRVSCIILAGGKAGRFGEDKTFAMLDGKPLIKHVYDNVKQLFDDVVVVVKNDVQKNKLAEMLRAKIIADKNEISSPLAGIKAGVEHVSNEYVFVVACDMPLVDKKVITRLLSKVADGAECVVPALSENKYEPLCAIYKKEIFARCDLTEKLQSIIGKIKNKKTVLISKEASAFVNINKKEDLQLVSKLKARRKQ